MWCWWGRIAAGLTTCSRATGPRRNAVAWAWERGGPGGGRRRGALRTARWRALPGTSPQFDAAEARAHAAAVLDRSGPHPASARNGLLSAVFSKLDCTPRWRERLPEITAPTLVVHGAADPFFPVGNARTLAEEIPGATLLVLDGVGAELPRRAHAEVAAAVLAHTAH